MRILRAFLLLMLCAATGIAQAAMPVSQSTAIVGTRVSLTPPAGFTPATQFPGYAQESSGASIMVTEIPGPFAELSAGFSQPAELSKKSMSLLSKQEIEVAGHRGLLAQVRQSAQGIVFLKWILIFGDQQESVMLTATFPAESARALSEKMKVSILTATWDRAKAVPLDEGLSFTISEAGGLKLTKRMSNALLYTLSGIIPNKSIDEPLFVVAQALSKIIAIDAEEYARSRLLQTNTVADIAIETSTKLSVDGLNGYEILASGKHQESGELMTIYQTMLFDEDTYYIMQGLVSRRASKSHVSTFKEMTASFKRRK